MSKEGEKMTMTVADQVAVQNSQVFKDYSELEFSDEVKEIEKKILTEPCNAQLWMEKGLKLSKQMLFREAVEAYSTAISYEPFNGLLYRHRGHRLLSTYRFKEASADFELSSRLDNTNWDTWYHLGLSYYLLGEHERAERAYKICFEMTEPENPAYVAIINWSYLNFMKQGKAEKAKEIIELVDENTEAGENFSYKEIVLVYKNILTPEEALNFDEDYKFANLELATKGYGISMNYYFNGEKQKSSDLLAKVLKNDTYWASFGYLASYCEVNRK